MGQMGKCSEKDTGKTHASLVQEALRLINSFYLFQKKRKMFYHVNAKRTKNVSNSRGPTDWNASCKIMCIDLIVAINYNNQLENDDRNHANLI